MCVHLSKYKTNILKVSENGIYHHQGRDLSKSHILPQRFQEKNIIEQYRPHFFSSEYAQIKFHKYFHHLNSSQALCINLFYPMITENALNLFLQFMGIPLTLNSQAIFEKDSDLEVAQRKTSFDFYLQTEKSSKVFVEVKYTEDGFGHAKNDTEHREKFQKTYLPMLSEKQQYLSPECLNEELFLKHYQVFRNLVHMSDTDYVVLLFPSANAVVRREADYARENFLTDKGRERLKIVYLDEFILFLENQCVKLPLDGYYQAFRSKYLPVSHNVKG